MDYQYYERYICFATGSEVLRTASPSRMCNEQHQGPVHTSNVVEATFDFVATNGNNVERNKLNIEHVQFVSTLSKGRISFDIVAETGNIVVKNAKNVEATFDTVERIVQRVAFDNVASTLLLVWTGLKARI